MKKSIIATLVLVMMLTCLVGCGEKKQDVDSNQSSSTGAELTQENILEYPESDPADFKIDRGEKGAVIVRCTSKDEVVVVPKEIDGQPIIGIASGGMAMLSARAIVFPDTVKTIGDSAFNGCENLEYIHLGSGLKSIGSMAFNLCKSLKQIIFPEGMETIVECPLIGCTNVEKIVIPASVTTISNSIVYNFDAPKAYIVTPEGSVADAVAAEDGIPVKRP